jgi:hypothetical protein
MPMLGTDLIVSTVKSLVEPQIRRKHISSYCYAVRYPAEENNSSSRLYVQTSSEAIRASAQWVLGSFAGGKARPGHDTKHLPPSRAEVKNE